MITGRLHSLVMVGVDTHFVLLQVEGVLARLHGLQLVVAVQVRPPPQAAVEDVGQTFPMGHLEASVQGPEQRSKVSQVHREHPEEWCFSSQQLSEPQGCC